MQKSKKINTLIKYLFLLLYFGFSIPTFAATDNTSLAANDETPPAAEVKDPLQAINRPVFAFNQKFDKYFFKPLATFYNFIVPPPLNRGIHNMFSNLGEIPTVVNDLLQFHILQSLNDFWRFYFNTTVGIGGFFDVASHMDLPHYENDFGLTLAYWGYQNSNYLILPFLGSYTVRDGLIGMPVDYFGFSVYPRIRPRNVRYIVLGLNFIDYRAQLLKFQPVFEEVALDQYSFIRNAYLQHRAAKIAENNALHWNSRQNDAAHLEPHPPEQKPTTENTSQ